MLTARVSVRLRRAEITTWLLEETGFRSLYLLSLIAFDLRCPNTLHFYGLPVLAGPVRDTPAFL